MAIIGSGDSSSVADEAREVVRDIRSAVGRAAGRREESVMETVIKDLSKAPAPKQLAVGTCAGWATGYATMKVGKMAATAIGGSLLLLQIAHHNGYIKVNWNRVTEESNSVAAKIKDKLKIRSRNGMEKFMDFASENIYLAVRAFVTHAEVVLNWLSIGRIHCRILLWHRLFLKGKCQL